MINNVVDKVVMILGDCSVGKTTIISNFLDFELKKESNNRNSNNKEKDKTICINLFKKVWIMSNLKRK